MTEIYFFLSAEVYTFPSVHSINTPKYFLTRVLSAFLSESSVQAFFETPCAKFTLRKQSQVCYDDEGVAAGFFLFSTTGPTLSPVSLLCWVCEPSHLGN